MGAMNSSQNEYQMSCKRGGSIYVLVEPTRMCSRRLAEVSTHKPAAGNKQQ